MGDTTQKEEGVGKKEKENRLREAIITRLIDLERGKTANGPYLVLLTLLRE